MVFVLNQNVALKSPVFEVGLVVKKWPFWRGVRTFLKFKISPLKSPFFEAGLRFKKWSFWRGVRLLWIQNLAWNRMFWSGFWCQKMTILAWRPPFWKLKMEPWNGLIWSGLGCQKRGHFGVASALYWNSNMSLESSTKGPPRDILSNLIPGSAGRL